MGNSKTVKIGIILLVFALLFGAVYLKKSSKSQDVASENPAVEENMPKEEEVQETATAENPEKEPADWERYEEAMKNDLPTLLEFKTSA